MRRYRLLDQPVHFGAIVRGLRNIIDSEREGLQKSHTFFNRYSFKTVWNSIPELAPTFEQWKCKPDSVAFYRQPPLATVPSRAHVDDNRKTQVSVVALNFPVYNCDLAPINFYDPLPDAKPVWYFDANRNASFHYDLSDIKLVESVYYPDQPLVFRSDMLHTPFNPTNKTRWTATFRFKDAPWHLFED